MADRVHPNEAVCPFCVGRGDTADAELAHLAEEHERLVERRFKDEGTRFVPMPPDELPGDFLNEEPSDRTQNDTGNKKFIAHVAGIQAMVKELEMEEKQALELKDSMAPILAPPPTRVSWDEYFMSIATQVATRATCDRKHVGAVIVKNKTILSTGYNGSPRGLPHCDDVDHEMKDMGGRMSCVRTVHAEANAIAQAARTGAAVDGAVLYTTASPCYDCLKLIINTGIVKIVCLEFYASRYGMSDQMQELARDAKVEMVFLSQET